jgi:arylsulfatase A-like enzyme
MPRLDQWAEQAYLFRDVFANASWTRPSVASLFTGLYPEEHGARDRHEALADRYPTLAESFQRSGYLTAAVVTNHAAVGRAAGFAQGFDTFVEPPLTPYARAEKVRAIAERLVRGRDIERPLFLYLHFLDPHDPYLAGSLPKGTRPTDYLPAYRAELAYLDNQLEGLLRFLESELGSRTWIAITSDHGEEFGDHGRAGHGHTLHRELVHVPFLLRGPGTDRGFVDDPLELRDLHSLLSRLTTSEVDPRSWASVSRRSIRYSSLEFSSPEAARWRRRYAVARRLDSGTETLTWSAYGNTYELYDSEADPFEKMNLSARLPARLAALAEALAQHTPARAPSTEAESSAEQKLRALGYL